MSAMYTVGCAALLLVNFHASQASSASFPWDWQAPDATSEHQCWRSACNSSAAVASSMHHVLFFQSALQIGAGGQQQVLAPTNKIVGATTATAVAAAKLADLSRVRAGSLERKSGVVKNGTDGSLIVAKPHDHIVDIPAGHALMTARDDDAMRTALWGVEADNPFQAFFVQPFSSRFFHSPEQRLAAGQWQQSWSRRALQPPEAAAQPPAMIGATAAEGLLVTPVGPRDWIFWLLIAYAAVWMAVLSNLMLTAFRPPQGSMKYQIASRRPEQEAWNKGWLSWVLLGWATQYFGDWGYPIDPSKTKVHASQLGRVGWEEDEPSYCGQKWERLWDEHMREHGKGGLTVPWVALKFCTAMKLLRLELSMAGHQLLMYLGLTHSVWWLLDYLRELEIRRQTQGPSSVTLEDLQKPTCVVIILFTVLPLWMILFETVMTLLNFRLSNNLVCGLQIAVFRKVQRLPVSNGSGDFDYPSGDGQTYRYSFLQLITTDINTGMLMIFSSLFRLITGLPIVVILTVDMCLQMRLATLHVLAAIVCMVIVLRIVLFFTVTTATTAQNIAGVRVTMSQELLYGIRLVKSFAWEDPFYERLDQIRQEELKVIFRFFMWMGGCMFFTFNYGRFMIFAGILGYMACYGFIPATRIFVFMQVLGAFNGEVKNLLDILPNIVSVLPSIRRLDFFFKLSEASHFKQLQLKNDEEEAPAAARGSSSRRSETEDGGGEEHEEEAGAPLRIKGSFAWVRGAPNVLSDIDLTFKQGELVAIVGEVGSGKSSLCQAIMGELVCTDEVKQPFVPKKVAYHAQIPLIIEGTVRENIIYYRDFDEERYNASIDAACFRRDLEMISGADDAPIGARGIMLSGGQKARVSLARAAYSSGVDHLLLDDPFGALDGPTAASICERLLLGPIMRGKTKVVVCQPENERLTQFDRVVVVSKGAVVADGPPSAVFQTREYKNLLHSDEDAASSVSSVNSVEDPINAVMVPTGQRVDLREEESQGRADCNTLKFFLVLGSPTLLFFVMLFFAVMVLFQLFADMQLVSWSNDSLTQEAFGQHQKVTRFFTGYAFWTIAAVAAFYLCWIAGTRLSLNVSTAIHELVMTRLMHAPVDRFYDKTPVGRILNRLAGDLGQIDFTMFTKVTETLCLVLWLGIPIGYVHCVTPIWFLAISIPFYVVLFVFGYRYWNVAVPLKYLEVTTMSVVNTYVTEAQYSNNTVRAYGVQEEVTAMYAHSIHDCLQTHFASACSRQWIMNRIYLMYSFFCTLIALICLWCPSTMDVGKSSLCLLSTVQIIMSIGFNLDCVTAAQFQFVSMNRLYEYLSLPQERAKALPNDEQFEAFEGRVGRGDLGALEFKVDDGRISILRRSFGGRVDVILEQVPDRQLFAPAQGKSWLDVAGGLTRGRAWHVLRGVDGVEGNAQRLAEELCYGGAAAPELRFESTWRTKAAHVAVKDLVAGYADIPQDILKGLTFEVLPNTRLAVVGTTGCGKSTLLLAFLRIIEPRAGSVVINGIDSQAMGLKALRRLLGLVPQDPVLFSGSIRVNLDPFEEYTDERMWEALEHVQMEKFVRGLGREGAAAPAADLEGGAGAGAGAAAPGPQAGGGRGPALEGIDRGEEVGLGLDWKIKSDGENVSYGQRQLLCTARMILRQPALLLLDECTSAIDPRTQELVQAAFAPKPGDSETRSAFPNSTIICIAHRLETVLDFDKVMVMQRGRIAEMGGVKELANLPGGLFASALTSRGQMLFSRAKHQGEGK